MSSPKDPVEAAHGIGVKGGHDVAIGVHRRGNRAVPEHVLDDLRVHSLNHQGCRCGVSEVMDADAR